MITFSYILMTLLMFAGLFLIGLILLQRGRGGGLAGAFGGMGGQSAFGTKAGDVFTRITIGVAAAWILLCAGSVVALHNSSGQLITGLPDQKKIEAGEGAKSKEGTSRNNAQEGDEDSSMDGNLKLDLDSQTNPETTPATENKTPVTDDKVKKAESEKNESDPAPSSDGEKKADNPAPEVEKN
jgi:preprotein translocase subunit SecG